MIKNLTAGFLLIAAIIIPQHVCATPAPAELETNPYGAPLVIIFWLIVAIAIITVIAWINYLVQKRKQTPSIPKTAKSAVAIHWSHPWLKKILLILGILVLAFIIVWLLAYRWSAQPLITY